ncbi:MAG: RAMP superfamily CRISPR-associated protein [Pyrinomonadaceae bacterium]
MLENNFKIRLEMLSDWQVGTGAGIPGSVDELISKDSKGFPQVPAKTIVGIWRDALERLCFGLDNGDKNGNWQKWVEIIFGSQPNVEKNPNKIPIPATLSLQPARISEILRAKIANDERLRQALFFVKVGVKIDELSGTSSTEMLRFEEMGRIGTVLQADCELRINDKTAKALLVLSAELVERIGGKRRRGAGRCKFSIENLMSKDDAITHLKTFQNGEKSPIPQIEEKADEIEFENSVETNEWQTCEYTLTLETPVSIVKAVLGNVSEALDFVPGTYLISHFIKHCGQDVFKAIQNNNFQISPATISIDGKRGFPVPKVFAQEKQKKEIIYNRLLENLDGKDQTKPIREGYVSDLFSDTVSHAFTPQTLLMHNAVDDSFQRPTTDVVGIYSREAIKAGIVLEGEIRFRNIQIEGSSIKGKVRIGTSKKDDYGLARLELKTAKPFKPKSVANSRKLVVYLASDVMLRNNKLRQTN